MVCTYTNECIIFSKGFEKKLVDNGKVTLGGAPQCSGNSLVSAMYFFAVLFQRSFAAVGDSFKLYWGYAKGENTLAAHKRHVSDSVSESE